MNKYIHTRTNVHQRKNFTFFYCFRKVCVAMHKPLSQCPSVKNWNLWRKIKLKGNTISTQLGLFRFLHTYALIYLNANLEQAWSPWYVICRTWVKSTFLLANWFLIAAVPPRKMACLRAHFGHKKVYIYFRHMEYDFSIHKGSQKVQLFYYSIIYCKYCKNIRTSEDSLYDLVLLIIIVRPIRTCSDIKEIGTFPTFSSLISKFEDIPTKW